MELILFFLGSEILFLKYNKFFRVSVSLNVRKFYLLKYKEFWQGFHFLKNKESFYLRNYISLTLEPEGSISPHIRKYRTSFKSVFLHFSSLGSKIPPGSSILCYYSFFCNQPCNRKSLDLTTMAVAIKRLDSEFVFITVP